MPMHFRYAEFDERAIKTVPVHQGIVYVNRVYFGDCCCCCYCWSQYGAWNKVQIQLLEALDNSKIIFFMRNVLRLVKIDHRIEQNSQQFHSLSLLCLLDLCAGFMVYTHCLRNRPLCDQCLILLEIHFFSPHTDKHQTYRQNQFIECKPHSDNTYNEQKRMANNCFTISISAIVEIRRTKQTKTVDSLQKI